MKDTADAPLEALIDRLHAEERLRVWSIVVTVFGDAAAPRGGELWLGTLQALMDRLRIGPGALRAAMSRLTADGWLVRRRVGRRSFYHFSAEGAAEFARAARRVYAPRPVAWTGGWRVHVLHGEAGEARDARRDALRRAGFGALSPTVFLRPETGEDAPAAGDDTVFRAELAPGGGDPAAIVAEAWPLEAPAAAYRGVVSAFAPLEAALADGAAPDPLDAMAARTLLVHDFRRAALRDPGLPPALLPADWPGGAARALAARLYARLAGPSEAWLDAHGATAEGPLPPAGIDLARRLGAG